MNAIISRSTEKGKEVYETTMYIPSMAMKITGEVIVSAKEFVFAFTNVSLLLESHKRPKRWFSIPQILSYRCNRTMSV